MIKRILKLILATFLITAAMGLLFFFIATVLGIQHDWIKLIYALLKIDVIFLATIATVWFVIYVCYTFFD